jgi:hypothetical protein
VITLYMSTIRSSHWNIWVILLSCVVITLIPACTVIPPANWISLFSRNLPADGGRPPESQRGAPLPAWSLIIQASGRVVADDSKATDDQMGGELVMRDLLSFRRSAAREAAGA